MIERSIDVESERCGAAAYELLRLERDKLHAGELILVNREHPVRKESPDITELPASILQAAHAEERRISLERTCLRQLAALLKACGGGMEIAAVSGYRSKEAQRRLYAESVKENGEAFTASYVALPGASEHQTGLAVDVGLYGEDADYIRPSFPDHGACGRFKELAAAYGFIQRYEQSKEALTGIACEPWHYRYVGFPHSSVMKKYGLCLEEYTEFVKRFSADGEQLCAFNDGDVIRIYYVAAEDGMATTVPVPRDAKYRLSGNNKDGFVVTVLGG